MLLRVLEAATNKNFQEPWENKITFRVTNVQYLQYKQQDPQVVLLNLTVLSFLPGTSFITQVASDGCSSKKNEIKHGKKNETNQLTWA